MSLGAALTSLRDVLARITYPLPLPDAASASALARATAGQLDDYLIPRLSKLDAPLLVVAGGSTGAGKSTLVNSIVRSPVSLASARRPTTRAPVLVCHPSDAEWFKGTHLLPHLPRGGEGLRIVPIDSLNPGLAVLDAPDIDSVEESNRALATQLLAAADLWLFVTTAVRYADAVPWEVLTEARDRGTAVAIVLNRVPPGASSEIAPHLREMLENHGLGTVQMFIVTEQSLDDSGLLPLAAVAPMRDWLETLAQSASARAEVVRQTVDGAIKALEPASDTLAAAADAQVSAVSALKAMADNAYRDALSEVDSGMKDGLLFRGEVLSRWQELVGTGEFMRGLQAKIGRLRDRVVSAVTGKPQPAQKLETAMESGLVTFVHNACADAAERTSLSWKAHPAGAALIAGVPGPGLAAHPELARATPDIDARIERMVRDWQRGVFELVREESGKKLFAAKASAYAVNALGLAVMIAVFAATAFIPTGAEIAVGAGTTVAAQKLLEAVFGDEAVRRLAGRARQDLLEQVRGVLDEQRSRFDAVLESSGVDSRAADAIRKAAAWDPLESTCRHASLSIL